MTRKKWYSKEPGLGNQGHLTRYLGFIAQKDLIFDVSELVNYAVQWVTREGETSSIQLVIRKKFTMFSMFSTLACYNSTLWCFAMWVNKKTGNWQASSDKGILHGHRKTPNHFKLQDYIGKIILVLTHSVFFSLSYLIYLSDMFWILSDIVDIFICELFLRTDS